MADGFLESRQQDYEARKQAFLRKRKHPSGRSLRIMPPDDEAL
jgi:hypothetical protein